MSGGSVFFFFLIPFANEMRRSFCPGLLFFFGLIESCFFSKGLGNFRRFTWELESDVVLLTKAIAGNDNQVNGIFSACGICARDVFTTNNELDAAESVFAS